MAQAIEAIFEDEVLKPLTPIQGLREHETVTVLLYPRLPREGLSRLAGTLTPAEASSMRRLLDDEFERVEGDW